MEALKTFTLRYTLIILVALLSCSKGEDTMPGGGNNGGTSNNNKDTNCVITAISPVNSGTGTESSLSTIYNSNYDLTKW